MNSITKKVSTATLNALGKSGLAIKRNAPAIWLGVGIASGVAALYFTAKGSTKVESVIDEETEKIENVRTTKGKIDEKEYRESLAKAYVNFGCRVTRLYAPAIIFTGLSLTSVLCSHRIMRNRNVALQTVAASVKKSYDDYREEVVNRYGEDIDKEIRYGTEKKDIEVVHETEDGKTKKKKVKNASVQKDPEKELGDWTRYFDEACPNWKKDPNYNLMFLKGIQNFANQTLNTRGYIFLNEVLEALGLQTFPAGQVVGWVLGEDKHNVVDFGIYNIYSDANRDFVNGYEERILLDFNCDGYILDKASKYMK